MENLQWRIKAKIVAIVDLIIAGFSALLFIVGFVAFLAIVFEKRSDRELIIIMIVFLIVFGAMTAIQMRAANNLLNACNKSTTQTVALKGAQNWQQVTIVFFILFIFGSLFRMHNLSGYNKRNDHTLWSSLIFAVWRFYSLFAVSKFIAEIKQLDNREPVNV